MSQHNPQVPPQHTTPEMPTNPDREIRKAGRDKEGRFIKGNTAGCGNPFARQTARMRQVMMDAVSEEQMAAAAKKVTEMALGGDMAAMKLFLQYIVGKPEQAPNPDRLDQEEFNTYRESQGAFAVSTQMLKEPDMVLPLMFLRLFRENNFVKCAKFFKEKIKEMDEEEGVRGEGTEEGVRVQGSGVRNDGGQRSESAGPSDGGLTAKAGPSDGGITGRTGPSDGGLTDRVNRFGEARLPRRDKPGYGAVPSPNGKR